MIRHLNQLLSHEDIFESFKLDVKAKLRSQNSSRVSTYKTINPNSPLMLYTLRLITIYAEAQQKRIATTRIRVGSHRLRVETGRWSRTPREDRLCVCSTGVQDEIHVLLQCPSSQQLRENYNIPCETLEELMNMEPTLLCNFIHAVTGFFN